MNTAVPVLVVPTGTVHLQLYAVRVPRYMYSNTILPYTSAYRPATGTAQSTILKYYDRSITSSTSLPWDLGTAVLYSCTVVPVEGCAGTVYSVQCTVYSVQL